MLTGLQILGLCWQPDVACQGKQTSGRWNGGFMEQVVVNTESWANSTHLMNSIQFTLISLKKNFIFFLVPLFRGAFCLLCPVP